MKTSDNGINLIKEFEGCKLTAYKCPAGVLTIGYGHTGSDVKAGMKITKERATELLKKDLEKFEKHVMKYDSKYHFNQNQFDALVSFAFNIGNIDQLTANGTRTIAQISAKIPAYNKAGGKRLPGLVKRRAKEKTLFDTASGTATAVNNHGYIVKVTASALNVRSGAGTNYKIKTVVKRNEVYTIVEVKNGWGKLKSGAGWICLKYTTKI